MSENIPLAERLKQQRAAENESLVSLTQQQLIALRSGLNDILQAELNTMRSDMREQMQAMEKEFQQSRSSLLLSIVKHRILFPALSTITVLAIIFLSGWGLSTWQESRMLDNWIEIASQKKTLSELESRTFGLNIMQDKDGKLFVTLPNGATAEPGWTIGKQKAVLIKR